MNGLAPQAVLFPGQGNQYPGMGWREHDQSERARRVFERAEAECGLPIRQLCFEGEYQELARTEITQPCVFVASLAYLAALEERFEAQGRTWGPRVVAGHSLGHFAALVAAGALPFSDALQLVCERGELMREAAGLCDGGMATIVGLTLDRVRALTGASAGAVVVAAVNSPGHVVVSGSVEGLDAITTAAIAAGAERAVRLPISIPSHSPAMAPAAEAFARHVDRARFRDARVPVMLNSTARPATTAARLRRELRDHMCNPVMWWPSVQAMIGLGVTLFAEAGPGHSFEKALGEAVAPARLFTLDRPGALASVVT